MQLVNDSINRVPKGRHPARPSLRVRLPQIQNGAAVAVDVDSSGIGVRRFIPLAFNHHTVSIVLAFQITCYACGPRTAGSPVHGDHPFGFSLPGSIQNKLSLLRGRGPQSERRLLRGIAQPQIISVITEQLIKTFIEDRNSASYRGITVANRFIHLSLYRQSRHLSFIP
ncbi:hypothetical protein D3C71_1282510 [compost metagenome]